MNKPLAVIFAVCLLGMPSVLHAQIMGNSGLGGLGGTGHGAKPESQKPAAPPPPALPGAETDNDRVAPADKPVADMPPTDALFDAINRGDLASARDAVGRGADLRGHNLLGMTPLELSVDLGRNNITFMLLSMRAGDSAPSVKAAAATTPSPKKPIERAEKRRVPPVRAAAAPAAPRPATQFAGDGGAPIPSAGFLGFDAGRGPAVR